MDDHSDHRRAVRTGYDALAATYDERRSADGEGSRLLARFADSLPEDPQVLDVGCGAGVPVAETLTRVGSVVGLDLSRGMLKRAARNVPSAALVEGEMTRLPFADGGFDGVVSSHAVIHVPRAEHRRVFEEFARVLRPQGRLLVVLGTSAWEGENENWLGSGTGMRWSISAPERDRELLAEAGFEVEAERTVDDELGGTFRHVTARLVG